MSKVTLELNTTQVESLVERLPMEDKIHLAQRLNLETWQARFKNLLYRIDKQLKGRKALSDEKTVQLVKKVRARRYAQSHQSHH